jgi:hypothetical protein
MLSTELCLPYRPPLKTDVGSILFLVRIARIYAKQFLLCDLELKCFGIPSSALETAACWFRPDSFLIAKLSLLFARNYKICHRLSPCYNGTPCQWLIHTVYVEEFPNARSINSINDMHMNSTNHAPWTVPMACTWTVPITCTWTAPMTCTWTVASCHEQYRAMRINSTLPV